MTKDEALYFLEGLATGLAANGRERLVKDLFKVIAEKYEVTPDEMEAVRDEIDRYLDQLEKGNGHDV